VQLNNPFSPPETREHYKKSSKISYQAFKELFLFEEDNDRDKKRLKKDYLKIEKEHNGKVKFKHLIGKQLSLSFNISYIDYYLKSSEDYGEHMKGINAKGVLKSLKSKKGEESGFNERLLRLICVNQAISKMQKELQTL
jgi:hypothetical protein